MAIEPDEEFRLAKACVNDNFDEVKAVLDEFPNINLNIGRNGTPLILTGSAKIGQLLIDNKAKINCVFKNGNAKLTALDSAQKTFEGMNKSNHKNKDMLEGYITFLKDNDALTYEELPKEEK